MIPQLYFPHPFLADPEGLLAIGGRLNSERLLLAYRCGIFPWNNEPPTLWWFTHPRCVLYPDRLKVAKSMRSYFNQRKYQVSYNRKFREVIMNCQRVPRSGQQGTWISDDIIEAYTELHHRGYAHSVEVWNEDTLVGGLYGISIGKIFYGESMFAQESNASKFGFISLVKVLRNKGFELIDCQQETPHLMSMGAEMIDKEVFWNIIKLNFFSEPEKLVLPTS